MKANKTKIKATYSVGRAKYINRKAGIKLKIPTKNTTAFGKLQYLRATLQ